MIFRDRQNAFSPRFFGSFGLLRNEPVFFPVACERCGAENGDRAAPAVEVHQVGEVRRAHAGNIVQMACSGGTLRSVLLGKMRPMQRFKRLRELLVAAARFRQQEAALLDVPLQDLFFEREHFRCAAHERHRTVAVQIDHRRLKQQADFRVDFPLVIQVLKPCVVHLPREGVLSNSSRCARIRPCCDNRCASRFQLTRFVGVRRGSVR